MKNNVNNKKWSLEEIKEMNNVPAVLIMFNHKTGWDRYFDITVLHSKWSFSGLYSKIQPLTMDLYMTTTKTIIKLWDMLSSEDEVTREMAIRIIKKK